MKYCIQNARGTSQPYNCTQLDLSGIRHFKNFTLDVTDLTLDYYRHAFFELQKEEETPLYFEYEDYLHKDGAIILTTTTSNYMPSYKRLESPNTMLITINFSNVDQFTICNRINYIEYLIDVPLWDEEERQGSAASTSTTIN